MGKYDELNEVAKSVALSHEATKEKVEKYLKNSAPTDKAKAIRHLWKHRKQGLTQLGAVKYGDFRLSAKIKELRDDEKFAIITVDEDNSVKSGMHGRYYLLTSDDIKPDGSIHIVS